MEDKVEHIAVTPPEYVKAHTVRTCPACGYQWNPNHGYDLITETHDHVYDAGAEGI